MTTRTLVTVMWLMAAGGCGKNEDTVHPVSWYLQHGSEMQAKVAWCVDDAPRQHTPDCMNAAEAKRRSLIGSQKSLAPIDWGASAAKP
jgi:hypothetical protein